MTSNSAQSPLVLRRLAIDMRDRGSQDEEEENCSDDEVANLLPETLLPDAGAASVAGRDVYQFQKTGQRRAGRMTAVASEAADIAKSKSPSSTPKKSGKKRTSKRVSIAPESRTPTSERQTGTGVSKVSRKSIRQRELKKQALRTPNRVAKRASQGNSDYDTDTDSVDDSDFDEDYKYKNEDEQTSSSDDSELEDDNATRKENIRAPMMACKLDRIGKKAKKKRAVAEMVEPVIIDTYFIANAQQSLTSDHTLSKLEVPRMDQGMLDAALEKVPNKYMEERKELYQEYCTMFNTWMFQLCDGHNLLFHGLGSKRFLLDTFRTTMLADFTHLVVNGYFPSITIKQVLNSIIEDILEHEGTISNPLDQVEFIKKYYKANDEDLFLIIHNIDGPMLRAEKVQTVLSMLAQVPNIHVIASIDHINAPLIWDQTKCSRFHWLWYDVTTFDPYIEETSYENSLLVQQSGVLALSSLVHVMRSLTPNSKQMFYLLANNQLEQQGNSNYIGMSKQDLYQRCREGFLVNSDLTLRAHLTEFKDHKLIKVRKGHDGMEYFYIPLDASTLKEFMDQQDNGD